MTFSIEIKSSYRKKWVFRDDRDIEVADLTLKENVRGWLLYIWVQSENVEKSGFSEFIYLLFCSEFYKKKIIFFFPFSWIFDFFRPNFIFYFQNFLFYSDFFFDFLMFFRPNFFLFFSDFLRCSKTFMSGQPLEKMRARKKKRDLFGGHLHDKEGRRWSHCSSPVYNIVSNRNEWAHSQQS